MFLFLESSVKISFFLPHVASLFLQHKASTATVIVRNYSRQMSIKTPLVCLETPMEKCWRNFLGKDWPDYKCTASLRLVPNLRAVGLNLLFLNRAVFKHRGNFNVFTVPKFISMK